jgi:hypothetical protein
MNVYAVLKVIASLTRHGVVGSEDFLMASLVLLYEGDYLLFGDVHLEVKSEE